MTHVGFGVVVNGKPAGIWPMDRESCDRAAARYRERDREAKVQIVSVHADMPIATRPFVFVPGAGASA